MKRKTFIPIGLTVFLSIGLLAGCQNKVLDYSTDETGSSIPMPITGETKWTEKLEGKQEDGSTVEIAIDADIVIPDADNMSVIEIEEPVFDAEYKEQMIKTIFGENPVYYNDPAHLPKKLMEEKMLEMQDKISAFEDSIAVKESELKENPDSESLKYYNNLAIARQKEYIEKLEKELQACKEALPNALETYQKAVDFESNSYRGEINGVAYTLVFEEEVGWTAPNYRTKRIDLELENLKDAAPEELKICDTISCDLDIWIIGEVAANQCQMTIQEASNLAEEYLKNLGMPIMVKTGEYNLVWYNAELPGDADTLVTNGYAFTFQLGIDGIAFPEFANEDGAHELGSRFTADHETYSCISQVSIEVMDDGVIDMWIENPVEVLSVTDYVELLSVERIQGSYRNVLSEDYEQLELELSRLGRVKFDELALGYVRVADPERNFHYSYVPAWQLSEIDSKMSDRRINSVFINAIDGQLLVWKDIV